MGQYIIGEDTTITMPEQKRPQPKRSQPKRSEPPVSRSIVSFVSKHWGKILAAVVVAVFIALVVVFVSLTVGEKAELKARISNQETEIKGFKNQISMFEKIESLQQEIGELESDKENRENERDSQQNENDRLKQEKSNITEDIKKYSSFVSMIKSKANKLGYYSTEFNASRGVVFLKKGGSTTFRVRSHLGGGATIAYSIGDSDIIYVETVGKEKGYYKQENNYCLDDKITAKETGVTTVKYYKEGSPSIGFEILVVVE